MYVKKSRRNAPAVNAGSMADIAFLLLIFFLVTTTILQEEGVLVRLPVWDTDDVEIQMDQNKVLTVKVNSSNELLVEGERVMVDEIPSFVMAHLNRDDFPATQAIVSLTHDRSTSYETYLQVYDALLIGYHEVRNEAAQNQFAMNYDELPAGQRKEIRKLYPLVLSEAEPTDWE